MKDKTNDKQTPHHTNNQVGADDLFSQQMQGVTPLKKSNRLENKLINKNPISNTKAHSINGQVAHMSDESLFRDTFSDAPLTEECPEKLSYQQGGLQNKTFKKLTQGKLKIDAVLNLRGANLEIARQELRVFLSECLSQQYRVVLIVHGKGLRSKDKPVIKPMLNRWLRTLDNVLAFHSAQIKDGGTGAIYVLFKRPE